MDGALQTDARNWWVGLPFACPVELHVCVRRICSWRVPPNWCATDWVEEVRAIAASAAWEAERQFDAARGVSLNAFIRSRVLARTLARYRQEWAYGIHCVGWEAADEDDDSPNQRKTAEASVPPPDMDCQELLDALTLLEPKQRWLVTRLFFDGRTQVEIARELGVSQPAVSKCKHAALQSLRQVLEHGKKSFPSGYTKLGTLQ